jgi:hypothetical protein
MGCKAVYSGIFIVPITFYNVNKSVSIKIIVSLEYLYITPEITQPIDLCHIESNSIIGFVCVLNMTKTRLIQLNSI